MEKSLPTLLDISPTNGLDLNEKEAVSHFFGKTLCEAVALFHENSIYYLDDLRSMGDKAFAFYLPAFCDYLQSVDVEKNSDDLNHFIGLIEFRLEYEPQSIAMTKEVILSVIDYCLDNYSKFGVDVAIYGDLRSKLIELQSQVTKLNGVSNNSL